MVLFMLDKVLSEKGSNHNWRISKIAMGLNMSEFIRVSGRETRPKFERIHAEGLCDCLASPTFVPLLSIPGKTCWSNWLMRYIYLRNEIYTLKSVTVIIMPVALDKGNPPSIHQLGGFPCVPPPRHRRSWHRYAWKRPWNSDLLELGPGGRSSRIHFSLPGNSK